MKRYIVLLFAMFFAGLLSSCAEQVESSKDYRFAGDGLIYFRDSEKLYTGIISDSAQVIMHYSVVDGKKNGNFLVYLTNGTLVQSGYLVNNRNEGEWKYFYPNGNLESLGSYKNDVAQGTWSFYYSDGSLKETGELVDGIRQGEWNLYTKYGELKNTFYFQDGEIADKLFKNA